MTPTNPPFGSLRPVAQPQGGFRVDGVPTCWVSPSHSWIRYCNLFTPPYDYPVGDVLLGAEGAVAETGLDTKTARHDAILELVSAGPVTSQGQCGSCFLSVALKRPGNLSRDLAFGLRAVKSQDEQRRVRLLPFGCQRGSYGFNFGGDARLARWCQDLLVSAQGRSPKPACFAHSFGRGSNLLGSAVDTSRLPGVLGTIAGGRHDSAHL